MFRLKVWQELFSALACDDKETCTLVEAIEFNPQPGQDYVVREEAGAAVHISNEVSEVTEIYGMVVTILGYHFGDEEAEELPQSL